jgi:hypothetical protein
MYNGAAVIGPARGAGRPTPTAAMHRSTLLAAVTLVLAACGSAVRAQPAPAPGDTAAVQQSVPRLGNLVNLATVLNLARGTVRIVAVVSPTSPTAAEGLGVIASILEAIPSKRLRAYVILTRAGDADTQTRALNLAAHHRDRRIVYLWDPDRIVETAFAPLVGQTGEPAREVYLLYDTAASFTTVPATPTLWMHMNPRLDGARLEEAPLSAKADELVRAVEKKAADAAARMD